MTENIELRDAEWTSAAQTYIDDPLSRISPPDLENAVRAFAEHADLESEIDILLKGAKLAKDPDLYLSIPGLSADEKKALKQQQSRSSSFLNQTKELQVTILTCAVAAVVQGWDQASINGANLRWPEDLGLAAGLDSHSLHDVWYFAFINAAPYLFASIVGAWLSDPMNAYLFGRRPAIFAAAIFCLVTVVGSSCVKTAGQLLACRILLGIGMGAKASIVPIFAAEVAPAQIRGSLVMNWQLFVAFGLFLGFSANLAVFNIRDLNWRLQLAAAALPALPLIVLIFVCPESPRFLIKEQKWADAYRSLCYLNKGPMIAAKELFSIQAQIQRQDDTDPYHNQGATSYPRRFLQLFTVPRIRRATQAAFSVMISQQACGVNALVFYSATLVSRNTRYDEPEAEKYHAWTKALWLSWGIGLTNFMYVDNRRFAWPAYKTIDRWGRRALLLLTIPVLALMLLGAAFSFKIRDPDHQLAAVATFMIFFMIFYSPGLGPVPFTYSAEVFPLVNREVGMSFSVFCNLLGAGILSLFVPFLNTSLTATGLLCLFAGLNVLAFCLVYFFVYETKQATLEELNSIFSVPLRYNVRYETQHWMGRVFGNEVEEVDRLDTWYAKQRNNRTRR
ncbi:hypothetical protein ANO11243_081040 [Dothideomycetidae sp. 11243]|nr:hypothetical protein ANO11243_081040 [fungal sp. No.11243]